LYHLIRKEITLPPRNKNRLLVPKEWLFVDSEQLHRSSGNCWWKRYW